MTSKNLLRAGALALACLIARAAPAFSAPRSGIGPSQDGPSIVGPMRQPLAASIPARDLIFGFGHVDFRPVQEAETFRCDWSPRSRHHHVRIAARCAYASRLARAAGQGSSRLLSVARGYLGRGNFTGFHEAWCADALRAWLRQSGHSTAGTDHRAISFAGYGRATSPHVGAIAVLRHHVGIVAGFQRRAELILISGNHGRRVALGVYPRRRILAFRDPV